VRGAALVRAPSGILLAFSGGKSNCQDGSVGFGVLLRTSPDNGTTWTPIVRIGGDDHTTGGYAAPMVDRQRGVLHLMYGRKFTEVWDVISHDNGVTWADPFNITSKISATLGVAIGPPGGVQLPSGRLVLAVHGGACNGTCAMYSDDGMQSWKIGNPVPFPTGVGNGGESQLVDDLRCSNCLTMSIRVSTKDPEVNHAIAQSDDGGETWKPATPVLAARGPTCEGSIARQSDRSILVSNPNFSHWRYPTDRKNMTVWRFPPASANGTLGDPIGEAQIFAGPSAYSALLDDGSYILFEGGETYRYASVMFSPVVF